MPARRIKTASSPISGKGLFACVHIAAGSRIIEYQGERISREEAYRRYGDNSMVGSTYLFAVNDAWLIDGQSGGNSARFINHSCDPNCEAVIWVDINGDARKDRVFIEAIRDIEIGEELTFDYALDINSPQALAAQANWHCRCASPKCRGSMLGANTAGN